MLSIHFTFTVSWWRLQSQLLQLSLFNDQIFFTVISSQMNNHDLMNLMDIKVIFINYSKFNHFTGFLFHGVRENEVFQMKH